MTKFTPSSVMRSGAGGGAIAISYSTFAAGEIEGGLEHNGLNRRDCLFGNASTSAPQTCVDPATQQIFPVI
ncbi:MAG: hypothetical protein ACE5I1_31935, partial [bacterium]